MCPPPFSSEFIKITYNDLFSSSPRADASEPHCKVCSKPRSFTWYSSAALTISGDPTCNGQIIGLIAQECLAMPNAALRMRNVCGAVAVTFEGSSDELVEVARAVEKVLQSWVRRMWEEAWEQRQGDTSGTMHINDGI